MASGASLPRTAIEWYMLGGVLVFLTVVVLLATGHTIVEAIAMGLFYGLGLSLVLVFLAVGWEAFRGDNTSN